MLELEELEQVVVVHHILQQEEVRHLVKYLKEILPTPEVLINNIKVGKGSKMDLLARMAQAQLARMVQNWRARERSRPRETLYFL